MTSAHLHKLIEPVAGDLAAFDRRLHDVLQADSRLITAVIRHLMTVRGKRLRPAVLFLSARSGGFTSARMVDAALAIEIIHTATLLHDDVVDESTMRRGQDTVNNKWNNLVSVLMGDFLFSRAFTVMVRVGSPQLIASISRATERVSFGELRQIEESGNYNLGEREYLEIISDKTASLFAVACEAGPILKKAGQSVRRRFFRMGEDIGIAFQIADDLLDYIGDSRRTGKDTGADLAQGRVTLPLIYSLSRSTAKTRQEIIRIMDNGIDRDGVDRILHFVREQGGIEYAFSAARSYSERAAELCDSLRNNIYSRTLKEILRFTVSRDN